MKCGYTETRANGRPVEAGFLCWKIDPEDGTHPIYVNGRTAEEIQMKLSLQNLHAQAALVKRNAVPTPPTNTPTAAAPIPIRTQLTADQRFQATADLSNPGKSAAAVTALVEEQTGINLEQLAQERFGKLAMEWEAEHPEYYPHPGNRTLVGDLAGRLVDRKVGLITKEILTSAFHQLRNQGLLFEELIQQQETPKATEPSTSFPAETQVQRTEGQTRRFATGVRGSTIRPGQGATTRGPKYTEADIRNMPESKRLALLEDKGQAGRDYEEACEYYYGQRATA